MKFSFCSPNYVLSSRIKKWLIFREEKKASTALQFLHNCRKRFSAVKVKFSTLQDYKEKTELEQGGSNNRPPILLLGNKIDLPNLRTDRQECCRRFSYTVASLILSFMEKQSSLCFLALFGIFDSKSAFL